MARTRNSAPLVSVLNKTMLSPSAYDVCKSSSKVRTSKKPSINNLVGEVLMIIFEFLPPDDRIRIERVCKRWKNLAENWSWTKYRVPAAGDFGQLKRERVDLRKLFTRSGFFIEEFSPFNFNQSETDAKTIIEELLPMLPKLKHLSLAGVELVNINLDLIPQKNLKSLVLPHLESSFFESLTSLLQQSNHLELLRIESCVGYPFDHLPSSLKCIEMDYSDYCAELVKQVEKQALPLVTLKLRNNSIGAQGFLQLSSTCSMSLTNLAVYLSESESPQFINLLHTFRNLRVLEVQFCVLNREPMVNEVILEIVAACPKLEKLSLKFPMCATPDGENLLKLAQLPVLNSVDICHFCCCRSVDVDLLLEKLSSTRALKYFSVDYELPSSIVNRVLKESEGLVTYQKLTQHTLLINQSQFEALTKFHGPSILPINLNDRRLHNLWFGYQKQDFSSHPWAVL